MNFVGAFVLIFLAIVLSVVFGPLYMLVAVGVGIFWVLILILEAYKKNHPKY